MAISRTRRQVRLSRALGIALTPKAQKYFDKRPYGPGEHGRARRRQDSDYSVRLKEKQRLRAQYGIREAQMQRAFEEARREPGMTGEALVELLEMRLDALVLRSGFARTTAQARQAVVHRHILVDGKLVDRPSFRVKPGQVIQVKPRSQTMTPFQVAAAGAHRDVLPEVPVTCDVQLVVEYYSR
jgi:small subunit ribosomal protein S4